MQPNFGLGALGPRPPGFRLFGDRGVVGPGADWINVYCSSTFCLMRSMATSTGSWSVRKNDRKV